jgi:CheY-like chemotaxis protein
VALTGLRILVVEDHRDTRETYSAMLRREGAVVFEAATAQVAMFILQANRPDLMLVDVNLPDATGWDFLEAVRRLDPEAGGRTPAVAITCRDSQYDRARSLMTGFKLHLTKPVEPDRLTQVIGGLVVLGL